MRNKTLLLIIASAVIVFSGIVALLFYKVRIKPAPEIRLVYKIDVDSALKEKLNLICGDLQEALQQKGIATRPEWNESNEMVLTVEYQEKVPEVVSFLSKSYGAVLDKKELGEQKIKLWLNTAVVNETRDSIVRQAVEKVRHRAVSLAEHAGVYLRQGNDLHIELPKMSAVDLNRIKRLMQMIAKLEFRLADDDSDLFKKISARVLPNAGISVKADTYDGKQRGQINIVTLASKDLNTLEQFFISQPVALRPPMNREVLYSEEGGERPNASLFMAMLCHRRAVLTGEDIQDMDVQWDERTSRPEVGLTFTKQGGEIFEEFTANNIGRRLAIILDGKVNSAPVIQTRIPGGRARITLGGYKPAFELQQEAKDLVAVLRAGALPAKMILVEEKAMKTLGN
jgi:protein-export membrane protein SecD